LKLVLKIHWTFNSSNSNSVIAGARGMYYTHIAIVNVSDDRKEQVMAQVGVLL